MASGVTSRELLHGGSLLCVVDAVCLLLAVAYCWLAARQRAASTAAAAAAAVQAGLQWHG